MSTDCYMPLENAVEATRSYVMPGSKKHLKFICSNENVDESAEIGIKFKFMVQNKDDNTILYDEFRVPRTSEEADTLLHRVRKDSGETYLDPLYGKFLKLQAISGRKGTSVQDVLEMLDTVEVKWQLLLEAQSSSKAENWSEVKAWVESNIPKARLSEYNGTEYLSWKVYNMNDENTLLVKHLEGIGGVTFRNLINGYQKPSKV